MQEHSNTNIVPFRPKAKPILQPIAALQYREPVAYGDGKAVPLHIESLHAFISAAAGELKVDDSVVEAVIKTLFNIDHVSKLPSQEFKSAVRFLVGLHGNASKISIYKKEI